MSRLSGRVTAPEERSTNDQRNKRMFAGMLGHLNSNGRQPERKIEQRDTTERESSETNERRFTKQPLDRETHSNWREGNRKGLRSSQGSESSSRASYEKPSVKPLRKRTEKIEDVTPVEELLDVDDIISQISDLNLRFELSAAQIKRNILHNKSVFDEMNEDDWLSLCETLLNLSLDQREHEFAVDLFISLIEYDNFCEAMSTELMSISSSHIMANGQKAVPTLLSTILCANWPRKYSKAIDTVNKILYTTACIIKGWIQVVETDTESYKKKHSKFLKETSTTEGEEESEEPEDPEIINRCALAISELCESAHRKLWMKWPTYCDEIYACVKEAILHNNNISGYNKGSLLSTLFLLEQWTKNKTVTTHSFQTQTVPI